MHFNVKPFYLVLASGIGIGLAKINVLTINLLFYLDL